MTFLLPRRGLAALPLLGLSPLARAATRVDPVLVEFQPGQAAAQVSVSNPGTEPASYEIDIVSWSQTPDADPQEDTSDILVSPPGATIPPEETQVLRLLLRRRGWETERAYRLLIRELPPPARGGGRQISFTLVSSIPVFVVPQSGRPGRLDWRVERAADGTALLVARNIGSRFVRIPQVAAATPGGQAVQVRPKAETPYVLPGVERHWSILGSLPRTGPLRLTGTTQAGAFAVDVPYNQ